MIQPLIKRDDSVANTQKACRGIDVVSRFICCYFYAREYFFYVKITRFIFGIIVYTL